MPLLTELGMALRAWFYNEVALTGLVAASRAMKLGGTVATVGFPNVGLQGFAPKLAKGEIASLSGAGG